MLALKGHLRTRIIARRNMERAVSLAGRHVSKHDRKNAAIIMKSTVLTINRGL